MGYDKLTLFITKNLTYKSYEEIYPIEDIEGSIISKHIYYDINFIVYKCINNIESDFNIIIKNQLPLVISNRVFANPKTI